MLDKLDETNFVLYAAKYYDNPSFFETSEFYDDINRFKYLKRLFKRYECSNVLKERLILNHIVVLYNVFGDAATPMLFYKLDPYHQYLKPFLVYIGRMPERLALNDKVFHNSNISMDTGIVNTLRSL